MRCHVCLRESVWGESGANLQCVKCGRRTASCSCEPLDISHLKHPTIDGWPVLVGQRVRVKGRVPTEGGPIAEGFVTDIRIVLHQDAIWIALSDTNEIFRADRLERYES